MFVRFRVVNARLIVSLVGTHRVEGKAQHKHIAQLPSVVLPMTIESRLAFWQQLQQKFSQSLSGRLNPEDEDKVFNEINTRIPAVTASEIESVHAKHDLQLWKAVLERYLGQINHYRKIKASAERKIEEIEKQVANVRSQIENAEKAVASKETFPSINL